MRFIAVVAVLLAILSRAADAAPPSNPSVEFLLTSAASDFHEHGHPTRFRHVRSGYAVAKDGAKQYRLCGEFLPAETIGKAEWTPFVTLQTSGYEQWLGGQAHGYCGDHAIRWDKGDWSAELQRRLDVSK